MFNFNFKSKAIATVVLGAVISCCIVSCGTTRISTSHDCANAIIKDTTVYHYFWGLRQAAEIKPPCDPRYNHLNTVVYKATFGNFLLTLITLGIVLPQKLNYCCAAPIIPSGDLNKPKP